MKSESVASLCAALAKAQAEIKPAVLNATNPFLHNRYADLGSIIEACRQPLAKHGLSVTQLIGSTDDGISVETILMHESGEWVSTVLALPLGEEKGKSQAQVAGSIITYLRRYALAAIVGVYAGDDDDGNMPQRKTESKKEPPVEMALDEAEEVISKDGRRYGDIPTEELSFHLKGISDALKKNNLSPERKDELLRKQAAARTILKNRTVLRKGETDENLD